MGMCILASKPETIYSFDGTYYLAKLDLQVSTAADLPTLGGVVEGTPYKCGKGSIAQIVQADEPTFVTLDGDSETWWPDQSGTDSSKSLSTSPTLNKAIAQSDGGTIDLTEDDIDKISDELGLEPFPEPIEEPVEETKKTKATEGGEVE